MAHSYNNFHVQNYQDSTNSYNTGNGDSIINNNRSIGNLDQQNNLGSTNHQNNEGGSLMPPHQSPNLFTNYCNMPPQFAVPPPPYPPPPVIPTTESMNFYQNYTTLNLGYHTQPYQSSPQHFQFENVMPAASNHSNFCNTNFEIENTVMTPTSTSVAPAESHNSTNEENNKENWIINWLKSIGKFVNTSAKHSTSKNVKIFEISDKIMKITMLSNKLENLSKSLSVTYKSLNEYEWKLRCFEIEEIKKEISDLLVPLSKNKELLSEVKWKIGKRKKKRERQRRKREEYRKVKVESNLKRQKLHQSIDQWLEDMKDDVERGRRDEELKREADTVLADVTRKKTEAKRQISLLSTLLKLRQARVTAQIAIGRNISQQQTDAFNNVIERLKSLWTNQLNGYLLEEQGLKVMLNEAAAEEKNSEALKKKEAVREWEKTLFGCNNKNSEHQPCSLNELINVRRQWDTFVVEEGAIMSSSIPPGWVVPVKASDSNWNKYIDIAHCE